MAIAKVQVTIVYEYPAEYDADGVVYEENERISKEAQTTLKEVVGSVVDIVRDGATLIPSVKVTSGGVSVATVPEN